MARPADIRDQALRDMMGAAFSAMRAGKGADSVKASSAAWLAFLELHPEVKAETTRVRGRDISRLMRWPALGANLKPESVAAGSPEVEFLRDRFSVSEAMTYYQFVLDEILEKEARAL
jgi:hypothetical protein